MTLLAAPLAAVMVAQGLLGLRRPDQYRDVEWIAATWWGNDWVTCFLAVPLLAGAHVIAQRGSTRATLLYSGVLSYAIYNYTFYLFGAALNVFFPLYAAALLLAALNLIASLSIVDARRVSSRFGRRTPVRVIGGFFLLVGASLAGVWIAMWGAYVFAGRPTPIEPEAFKLVAATDLVMMVPALTFGGALLWRREPWGYVISAIAGVQASLYLTVLTINSVAFLVEGRGTWPGELLVWGTLAVLSSAMTLVLFLNIGSSPEVSHGASGSVRVVLYLGGGDGERHAASSGAAAIAWRLSRPGGELSHLICSCSLHRDERDHLDAAVDRRRGLDDRRDVAWPDARV